VLKVSTSTPFCVLEFVQSVPQAQLLFVVQTTAYDVADVIGEENAIQYWPVPTTVTEAIPDDERIGQTLEEQELPLKFTHAFTPAAVGVRHTPD
jgi:hypothetical protein